MPGLSRYESSVALRYGAVDTGIFTRQAFGILDTRVGSYRGYGVMGTLIFPVALELANEPGLTRLRLRIGAEPQAGVDLGFGGDSAPSLGAAAGSALDLDVAIEPDARAGLRLAGLGPTPLPFRRGTVDAVRCATFVFGLGDIDGEGPTAEFGVTVRPEAGLQCAYAYGTLEDPYTPRWEVSVRSAAVVARDRALPESAAIGRIAAHCLA
jgi:hypothetical protein